MKLTKETEIEIRKVYQAYWDAYLSGDFETFASFLDDDIVIYGTAVGEIFYSKAEALKFYMDTAEEMTGKADFRNRDISIKAVGNTIVIYDQCQLYILIEDTWTFYGSARITGILEQKDNMWKLVHQHGSFPDSRTEEGQQIASEKIKEENLQLREAVQRRTVELENKTRELSIEASLERVRTVAMGMRHPNDMLQVCQIISEQLQLLSVKDIRNVQTAIIDERGKGTYMNYQYFTQYEEGTIEEVVIANHPAVIDMIQHMQQSPDAFFSHSFEGDALTTWKQYRKDENQFPDPILDNSAEVHFYFYSIGEGGLGLSAYSSLTIEDINVFHRFRNVFALAYQRFRDIEKAETQTREASIEASLERARSKAMAMHSSEDLAITVDTFFFELNSLGVTPRRCGVGIVDRETQTADIHATSATQDTDAKKITGILKLSGHPVLENIFKYWERQEEYHPVLRGREILDYYKVLNPQVSYPDFTEDEIQYGYYFNFTEGGVFAWTDKPYKEDELNIFRKFTSVINLTYKRYMDLVQAEASAREAQIETGLERVRSRTMAMQSCDELAETASVVLYELVKLGISPNRLYIAIIENDSTDVHFYLTNEEGGKDCSVYTAKIENNSSVRKMYDGWATHQSSITLEMEGQELSEYFTYLRDEVGVPYKISNFPSRRVQTIAYFSQGYIGIASQDDQPAETTKLLERFAAVFNLTYTRFNDLKQAEKLAYQATMDLFRLKEEKARTELALTELKAAQALLIQSEKMASLGELTAGIAHEIQNPLNFVNNFSDVNTELIEEMKEELKHGNNVQAVAIANDIADNEQKINHHGKRADAIVKGMLMHSRTSGGIKEPTDINSLADEYLRLAYHGLRAKDKSFNATMKTDFDKTIGKVDLIPQDIGRVILNLITNAFYAVSTFAPTYPKVDLPYTPIVTVTTKLIKSPSGDLGANKVTVSVSDNGPGISQHNLDKIFQPFFTTKPSGQGTGLGLSLSYDIVKAHGGELKVETKEGEGTVFTIQLPIT